MKTLDENVTPNRYPLGHMRLVSWTITLYAPPKVQDRGTEHCA
jgi:hypothetical protein